MYKTLSLFRFHKNISINQLRRKITSKRLNYSEKKPASFETFLPSINEGHSNDEIILF